MASEDEGWTTLYTPPKPNEPRPDEPQPQAAPALNAGWTTVTPPPDKDPWAAMQSGPEAAAAAQGAAAARIRAPYSRVLPAPEEPSGPMQGPPDKYQWDAMQRRQKVLQGGGPTLEGYTDRATRGALMGWQDDFHAGIGTLAEMAKRGTWDMPEAYRYARAYENLRNQKLDENTAGPLGAAAEVLGGVATGGPVVRGVQGGGRAWNYAKGVGKGAGLGAVAGAGEAPSWEEIPQGAGMGAVLGGSIGAALPPVLATMTGVARAAQMPRLRDPEKVATGEIQKTLRHSGRTFDEVAAEVQRAQDAGHPEFILADAMGRSGQRKLTGLAKVPGEARERISEFINERDLNMPPRVGAAVGQSLGAPGTARQATDSLIQRASRDAGPLFRQSERVPTWSPRLQEFIDDPVARQGLAQGVEIQRLRATGTDTPFRPIDAMVTGIDDQGRAIIEGVPNMRTLQAMKVGLDRMIENEVNPATMRPNARGEALIRFRNGMLEEMDALNPVYGQARAAYRGPMEVRDAVQTGREMATRGRHEDTVPAFRALPEPEKQGVRIGYADAVREPLERTGNFPTILREKSQKGVNELAELSRHQGPLQPGRADPLREYLNREETMQRTSKNALGGPATAENLADMGAQPGGVADAFGLAHAAASGNMLGMARNAYDLAARYGRGQSEAQRSAIARLLLSGSPETMERLAARLAAKEQQDRGTIHGWRARNAAAGQ